MEYLFYIAGVTFIFTGVVLFVKGLRNIAKGFFMLWFSKWQPWQLERLKICNECAPEVDYCPECLCFKEPKVKVLSEVCPLKKWPVKRDRIRNYRISSGINIKE